MVKPSQFSYHYYVDFKFRDSIILSPEQFDTLQSELALYKRLSTSLDETAVISDIFGMEWEVRLADYVGYQKADGASEREVKEWNKAVKDLDSESWDN